MFWQHTPIAFGYPRSVKTLWGSFWYTQLIRWSRKSRNYATKKIRKVSKYLAGTKVLKFILIVSSNSSLNSSGTNGTGDVVSVMKGRNRIFRNCLSEHDWSNSLDLFFIWLLLFKIKRRLETKTFNIFIYADYIVDRKIVT